MKPAPSSMRETALFGHGNEVAQVTEFHRSYPYLEGMVQSYKVFVYGPVAPMFVTSGDVERFRLHDKGDAP
jgi:hypothetical protein